MHTCVVNRPSRAAEPGRLAGPDIAGLAHDAISTGTAAAHAPLRRDRTVQHGLDGGRCDGRDGWRRGGLPNAYPLKNFVNARMLHVRQSCSFQDGGEVDNQQIWKRNRREWWQANVKVSA